MRKSQWQKLFWTACSLHFDDPSEGLNISAFDVEKYPALNELQDLHYLEVLMLAYSIILSDKVSDDWEDEALTGELLFDELTLLGNVELGIQVLVKKGWLIGNWGENWENTIYEVNLKKLVEDGLLTSCERPEVSEEEILPVEFPVFSSFGEQVPLIKTWRNLCHHIYWYCQKKYDWVVYENLKPLCHVFMERWQLTYEEFRVLAVACHVSSSKFTEEEVVTIFHQEEISLGTIQTNFEKLVSKAFFKLAGFNDEVTYLFELDFKIKADLTQHRLHYNEDENTFTMHTSSMSAAEWEEIYHISLGLASQGHRGEIDAEFFKNYPVLRYVNLPLVKLLFLSYLIIEEAAHDKNKNKFINLSHICNHFVEYGIKNDCIDELMDIWHEDKAFDNLKELENKFWISILTSTHQTEHYIKVKMETIIAEGFLLK